MKKDEILDLMPYLTAEERAEIDSLIISHADGSGDGQAEIVLALRSGVRLEELVCGSGER